MLLLCFAKNSKAMITQSNPDRRSRDLRIWVMVSTSCSEKAPKNMNMPHSQGPFRISVVGKQFQACRRHLSLAPRRCRVSTVLVQVDTRLESPNRTAPNPRLYQRLGPARQASPLIEITGSTNYIIPDGCQTLQTVRRDESPARIRLSKPLCKLKR